MTQIIHNLPEASLVPMFGDLPVGTVFTCMADKGATRTFIKLMGQCEYGYKARCISDHTFGDGNFTAHFTAFKVVTRVEFHYD